MLNGEAGYISEQGRVSFFKLVEVQMIAFSVMSTVLAVSLCLAYCRNERLKAKQKRIRAVGDPSSFMNRYIDSDRNNSDGSNEQAAELDEN